MTDKLVSMTLEEVLTVENALLNHITLCTKQSQLYVGTAASARWTRKAAVADCALRKMVSPEEPAEEGEDDE